MQKLAIGTLTSQGKWPSTLACMNSGSYNLGPIQIFPMHTDASGQGLEAVLNKPHTLQNNKELRNIRPGGVRSCVGALSFLSLSVGPSLCPDD